MFVVVDAGELHHGLATHVQHARAHTTGYSALRSGRRAALRICSSRLRCLCVRFFNIHFFIFLHKLVFFFLLVDIDIVLVQVMLLVLAVLDVVVLFALQLLLQLFVDTRFLLGQNVRPSLELRLVFRAGEGLLRGGPFLPLRGIAAVVFGLSGIRIALLTRFISNLFLFLLFELLVHSGFLFLEDGSPTLELRFVLRTGERLLRHRPLLPLSGVWIIGGGINGGSSSAPIRHSCIPPGGGTFGLAAVGGWFVNGGSSFIHSGCSNQLSFGPRRSNLARPSLDFAAGALPCSRWVPKWIVATAVHVFLKNLGSHFAQQ
jgi:hypothetical protein